MYNPEEEVERGGCQEEAPSSVTPKRLRLRLIQELIFLFRSQLKCPSVQLPQPELFQPRTYLGPLGWEDPEKAERSWSRVEGPVVLLLTFRFGFCSSFEEFLVGAWFANARP